MPRLVLDARALQPGFKAHAQRGIGRYAKNLLPALLAELDPGEASLLVQGNLAADAVPAGPPRVVAGYLPAWLPRFKRLASHYWLVRRCLRPAWREGALVHFLCHLDAPLLPGTRTVVTVHDLIAQRLEALYKAPVGGLRFRIERHLETRVLYRAPRLIAVSEQTKRDLMELYAIPEGRIRVVYEAGDPGLAPEEDPARRAEVLARHGLSPAEPFFLYLGGIDQRKGLSFLLAALVALKARGLPHNPGLAGRIEDDNSTRRWWPRSSGWA